MLADRLAVRMVVMAALVCMAVGAQPPPADRGAEVENLVKEGKLEDAVETCRSWVREDPEATKPRYLLADVYVRLKLWDRAQEELEAIVDLNPAAASAHARLGDLHRLQEKHDQARQRYQDALRVDPRCLDAHMGLARIALDTDRLGEAAPAVDMAQQIAPDNGCVLALAGELSMRLGRMAEATERLAQALEKDPDCANALYWVAVLTQSEGPEAEDEAQEYWDRFLEAEPDSERAWLARYGLVVIGVTEVPSGPGKDTDPDLSPDGTHAATVVRDGEHAGVWVVALDGSAPPRKVVEGPGVAWVRWTADGSAVLFDFRYEDGGNKTRTFLAPADGQQDPVCLTEDAALTRVVGALPGTDRIVYTDARDFGTMTIDGADRQRLPSQNRGAVEVSFARVSPDGKSVVYQSVDWNDKREGGPARNIAVAPLDGSLPPRIITAEYPGGTRIGHALPAWAPDGKRITLLSDQHRPNQGMDMFAMLPDDPHPPVLLARGGPGVWSPDGTWIVYTAWSQQDPGGMFVLRLGGKRLPIVEPE